MVRYLSLFLIQVFQLCTGTVSRERTDAWRWRLGDPHARQETKPHGWGLILKKDSKILSCLYYTTYCANFFPMPLLWKLRMLSTTLRPPESSWSLADDTNQPFPFCSRLLHCVGKHGLWLSKFSLLKFTADVWPQASRPLSINSDTTNINSFKWTSSPESAKFLREGAPTQLGTLL